MEKIFLGTNWKMHKTVQETREYLNTLLSLNIGLDNSKVQLFVIPPYTSLWDARDCLTDTKILLGAQNMHWEDQGAFTGEISPLMLEEIGIDIVELGHSERRQYYNETDQEINKKVHTALKYRFTPLVCIGEKDRHKQFSGSEEIVREQLKTILAQVDIKDISNIWIAYEPVWAIGEQGKPAEPSYVAEIHQVIREVLVELYHQKAAKGVNIFYGGSVNLANAYQLIKQDNVDGLFIGRSAWSADSFTAIINHLLKKCFY